jgi:hypothetical protein
MSRRCLVLLLVGCSLLFVAGRAGAALVPAPGYAAHTIPITGPAQGGVVRRGDAILVGQGPSFTAGAQSVVRVEGGVETTVATGFNSLGGFDLDDAGTLYVVDNAFELPGAATGDTVFAIPDALTRATALPASGLEVLPAGSISTPQSVLVVPGGLLVVAAAGPGAGRIVRIAGGVPTDFITGLAFGGGLARAGDGTLFVGDVSASFVRSIFHHGADGSPLGTFATDLPGEYEHVFDEAGHLLVSGEFSFDCTGRILAIPPGGGMPVERVRGFCFASDLFFDAARAEVLALDFEATEIAAVCRDTDDDGVCDVDDDCPAIANPAQTDADGDGVGDACDACTGPAIERAKVTATKLATGPGDDRLAFKGRMTIPTTPPFIPFSTGVRVLVNDGGILDAVIPGGAYDKVTRRGWKVRKGKVSYHDAAGTVGGIRLVRLRPSKETPGLVTFVVKGRDGDYPIGADDLPLQGALVVDASAEQCGDVFFADSQCVLKSGLGRVQCR